MFAIELTGVVATQQYYRQNTAIVVTVLSDGAGNELRITDFCPRFRQRGRMHKPMMFVRIVEPVQGRPSVRIKFTPANGYGARASELTAGSHHLRVAATDAACRLTTDASLSAIIEQLPFELDRPLALIFGPDETIEQAPLTLAHSWMEQTANYWEEWVRSLAVPVDWQAAVIRAAITLKLSTYEDSGAVLAAITTSIPESPDSGRNWDYRYCWLRDSCVCDPGAQPAGRDANHGRVPALPEQHRGTVAGRRPATGLRAGRRTAT